MVLSLEEVEGGLKGLKVEADQPQAQPPRGGCGTPFMAEQLEQALTGGQPRISRSRDSDMSAFNKLVSSMKASGTLPTQPNVSVTHLFNSGPTSPWSHARMPSLVHRLLALHC